VSWKRNEDLSRLTSECSPSIESLCPFPGSSSRTQAIVCSSGGREPRRLGGHLHICSSKKYMRYNENRFEVIRTNTIIFTIVNDADKSLNQKMVIMITLSLEVAN